MQATFIKQLREDTIGCRNVLHLNNAGSALPPLPVVNAVKGHLDLEAAWGGYEAAELAFEWSEQVYNQAAKLINCQKTEIAFTENATRAWEMAFYGFNFQPGDRIITGQCEYASNYLAFIHMARRTGAIIDVIANDDCGQLNVAELVERLDERVKLIAITHIPTQGGLINPAVAVGQVAKQYGIPYLLDATQSIGQMPIDVQAVGCDFLCATGRKYLRGPRGTGFLFARHSRLLHHHPPFVDLHAATWSADNDYHLRADARRFETWEQNIAAKIGLGVAIDYALQIGMDIIWERIQYLAGLLRAELASVPGVVLQDLGSEQCGIVTLTSSKKPVSTIQQELAKRKINTSISLAEYARLDLVPRGLPELLRVSVHYYNTEEEIEHFVDELAQIQKTEARGQKSD